MQSAIVRPSCAAAQKALKSQRASRGISEMFCEEYWHERGLKTFIARFHNVYGPHGTWTGGREIKEYEAEKDRGLAHVGDRPRALRKVLYPIGSRHFARGDECGETREEPNGDKKSTDELDRARGN